MTEWTPQQSLKIGDKVLVTGMPERKLQFWREFLCRIGLIKRPPPVNGVYQVTSTSDDR